MISNPTLNKFFTFSHFNSLKSVFSSHFTTSYHNTSKVCGPHNPNHFVLCKDAYHSSLLQELIK